MSSYLGNSYSSRDSGTDWVGTMPLRIGAGMTLLYLHGWGEAVLGWQHLVNQKSWPLISLLEKGALPYPHVLTYIAAAITAVTATCWIIGFLTRFFSLLFLPVAATALLLANRLGEPLGAEAALLYLLIAITLVITGPEWFSVDALFQKRRNTRR
jgi:uncharacterized membrane protein YphA (DoxX/SURF4 family)